MKRPKIDPNNPSIIVKDMTHCLLCGKTNNIEWHHVFSNSNRNKSTEYKLIVPLCQRCHQQVHQDYELMHQLRVIGQIAFEKEYPNKDFLSIFHRNYKGDAK